MNRLIQKAFITAALISVFSAACATSFQGIYFGADGAYFSGNMNISINGVSIPNCFYQCQPTVAGPSLTEPVVFSLTGSQFKNLINPYQNLGLPYGANILAYVVIIGNKQDGVNEANLAQRAANTLISNWLTSYCNPSNNTCSVSTPVYFQQFTPPTTYMSPQLQYANYVYVSITQTPVS